jgi:hypothetical protein
MMLLNWHAKRGSSSLRSFGTTAKGKTAAVAKAAFGGYTGFIGYS